MIKVYIASQYTVGDPEENVRRQIDAWHDLRDAGMFPFAPLLAHHLHAVKERSYEDWLDWDLEWLKSCDVLVRLAGPSLGADREVQFAALLGMSIFYSVEACIDTYKVFVDR